MKALVRYITKKRDGTRSFRNERITSEVLHLGRGTYNEIDLPGTGVLLREGSIHKRDKQFYFEIEGKGGNVSIDGNFKRTSLLEIGSVISIGPYDISFVNSEDDVDLTLDVELVRSVTSSLEYLKKNSSTRISQVAFGIRKLAWLGALVIFGLFFLWPILNNYYIPLNSGETVLPDFNNKVHWPMSGDLAWNSGEISNSHKFISKNCSVCHEKPFQKVQNSVCASCHTEVSHHVDPEIYGNMQNITDNYCQSCHKEHKGPESIVRSDQKFCSDCHGNIEAIANQSNILNATDFGSNHPQFRPTIIIDSLEGRTERISLDNKELLKEESGLKFPHNKHLKLEGVFDPSIKQLTVLSCGDCHESSGSSFIPVNMGNHCADCHVLNFEPKVPDRTLPHASPVEVMLSLREFYSDLALRGGHEDETAPEVVRRNRPGRESVSSLSIKEKQEALSWATSRVEVVSNRVFSQSGCGSCHIVKTNNSENPMYEIVPVMVSDRWLPKARFDHSEHSVSDCSDCHSASSSSSSKDVLIPEISICQNCHGGEHAVQSVPSTCVSCHDFHLPQQGLMKTELDLN